MNRLFFIEGIPSMLLVGPSGLVEDYEGGVNANLETVLPEKIDKLLAGGHLYEAGLKAYHEELQQVQQEVASQAEGKQVKPQEIPTPKIAEASQPSHLKLKSLWKSSELQLPGNILVVARGDGTPRICVLDNYRAIAELGPDGKVQGRHEFDIPKEEVVSVLSTAVDGGGKRYFAGWTAFQQQVHLFDENWKRVVDFPADALENKHPGITHALLADLTGEGKLMLYVGYWGTVGVQGVSFEGRRVWSNRSLENVLCLATTPADDHRERQLMCLDTRAVAVLIDAKGVRKGETMMGLRPCRPWSAPSATATPAASTAACRKRNWAVTWRWAWTSLARNSGPTSCPREVRKCRSIWWSRAAWPTRARGNGCCPPPTVRFTSSRPTANWSTVSITAVSSTGWPPFGSAVGRCC